jgi:hypothetical protein
VPTSIGVARRGDYAIGGSATPGQFGLQALRLLFHSHPAQLANAFDKIVRPALAFCRIMRLWLLERHWHERPPRYAFAFSFSFAPDGRNRWPQPSSTFHIGPLDDRTPQQMARQIVSASPHRQLLPIDRLAQEYRRAPQHIAAEN